MTSSLTRVVLIAAVTAGGLAFGFASAQDASRQLQAQIVGVAPLVSITDTADYAPDRLSKYAERSGSTVGRDLPVSADAEAQRVLISIAFADLPQRALAPTLFLDGEVVGIAVGAPRDTDTGLTQDFLVLPSSIITTAGGALRDEQEEIHLTVQMGDDARTATILTLDDASRNALTEALEQ